MGCIPGQFLSRLLLPHALVARIGFLAGVAARQLAFLQGGKIRGVVPIMRLGVRVSFRQAKDGIELSIGLQPHYLAPFGPTVTQMMPIIMIQLIDRPHIVIHTQPILQAIQLKLLQRLIEGKPIENPLIDQVLLEVNAPAVLDISILLDNIDQVDDHLRLRAMQFMLVNVRDIVRHILGEIGVHPDPHLSPATDEDHLLANVEVPHLLIEDLETLERGLDEVQLIAEGDIVDLLQPEVHLLDIQQSLMDGRAQIL